MTPGTTAGTPLLWERFSALLARRRGRTIRDGLWIAGLLYLAFLTIETILNGPAYDARAYYDAHLGSLYVRPAAGSYDAYYYSPAFAQVLAPLTALPWQVFIAVWMVIAAVALAWLAGPVLIFVLLFPPVVIELQVGNVHFLSASRPLSASNTPRSGRSHCSRRSRRASGSCGSRFVASGAGSSWPWAPRPQLLPSRSHWPHRSGLTGWVRCALTPARATSGRSCPSH